MEFPAESIWNLPRLLDCTERENKRFSNGLSFCFQTIFRVFCILRNIKMLFCSRIVLLLLLLCCCCLMGAAAAKEAKSPCSQNPNQAYCQTDQSARTNSDPSYPLSKANAGPLKASVSSKSPEQTELPVPMSTEGLWFAALLAAVGIYYF